MRKVLQSVEGVKDVQRNWFNENRYSFSFQGRSCVVHEAFGDNDRYWIGPADLNLPLNMAPVHDAFRVFQFRWTGDREFRE